MVEPVSITLASVGLFFKILEPLKKAYNAYQLTAAFGVDFDRAQRQFFISYVHLETISKTKLSWIEFNDIMDEGSELNRAIRELLRLISIDFEQCNMLMKKYHDKEEEVMTAMESDGDKNVPETQPPAQGDMFTGSQKKKKDKIAKFKSNNHRSLLYVPFFSKKTRKKQMDADSETVSISTNQSTNTTLQGTASEQNKDVSGTANKAVANETGSNHNEPALPLAPPVTVLVPSGDPPSTPSATVRPPNTSDTALITSASVQEAINRAEATQLKKNTNAWHLVKWADHDRDLFNTRLESIRALIIDLEALIRYKEVQDPSPLLGQPSQWSVATKDEQSALALKRLDKALASTNPVTSSVDLHVQVIEDPEREADSFSSQEGSVTFDTGSLLFVFQAQTARAQADKSSVLLYVESKPLEAVPADGNSISELSSALSTLDVDDESQQLRVVGEISGEESDLGVHRLFSPALGSWASYQTLASYLGDVDFQSTLTKQRRLQVARLLSIAYLQFAKVMETTHQYLRPDRVSYFGLSNEPQGTMPDILNPYLSIGFGKKKPMKWPGRSSGLLTDTVNPVVELGLILYQIGSGTRLSYGTGNVGVSDAKKEALRKARDVDKGLSGDFTEVVQKCLNWRGSITAPVQPQDYVFIDRVRHWLKTQEDRLSTSP